MNWEEVEGNDNDYSLESYADSDGSEESQAKEQQRILEEEQEIIKELEEEMILKGLKEKQGELVEKVEEECEVQMKDG